MTDLNPRFGAVLFSLWLRLITLGPVALLVAAVPEFPSMIENWRLYQSTGEIIFGVAVRAVFVALTGVALGTVCTAVAAPFLLRPARQRAALVITRIAVVIAAFWDLSILARSLVQPLAKSVGLIWFPTMILYTAAFAIAMMLPRSRKQIVTSLDGMLEEKSTRRAALIMAGGTAAVVATEWVAGKAAAARPKSARAAKPAGPNVLLVTFDALSAEDMSLYGYRLPTTPCIGKFAANSTVFTNFYSACTFTTPSVATILTGAYPSEHGVYHLQGRMNGRYSGKSLPRLMQAGGYATGASLSNPAAYCLAETIADDYDIFPSPPFRRDDFLLWRATAPLHQRQPFGSRAREAMDIEKITRYLPASKPQWFGPTKPEFPPSASFAQAREVIDRLPDGYFMWVHVFAPHAPYIPAAPQFGRFLPLSEMRNAWDQWLPEFYPPEMQPLMDKARLRYDEYIAESDKSFDDFLAGLEAAGRLNNTAVIVAADHGESFQGQVFTHDTPYQVRPTIHIPLIVRMPGQSRGCRIQQTIDQTALAPSLLEIAGLPRPDSMRGRSIVPLLNSQREGAGDADGLAFCQYLETNSIFRPIDSGTVGVIDGRHQYILDIGTGKGILRPLAEAQSWNLDRSAGDPVLARKLREAIYTRFPDLPNRNA